MRIAATLVDLCGRGCGADLAGVPVLAQRRHQVTGIAPAPPPAVTGYVAQARACPCCRIVSEAVLPAHVRARASYGPVLSWLMPHSASARAPPGNV